MTWRDFWDFGTAPIGDFFCHNFDPALWALDLGEPLSVEAHSVGGVDPQIAPPGGIYTYRFGAREKMPPVKFTWYEGGLMPARPDGLEPDDRLGAGGNGILFIGDKGMLTCAGWGGRPTLLPGSATKPSNVRRRSCHGPKAIIATGWTRPLSASDLMLMPSQSESFGLSALEAMACEVPVISSSVGGLPELQVHGETGYIAEIGDIDRMARYALDLLMSDTKRKMFGAAGRPSCGHDVRHAAHRVDVRAILQALPVGAHGSEGRAGLPVKQEAAHRTTSPQRVRI